MSKKNVTNRPPQTQTLLTKLTVLEKGGTWQVQIDGRLFVESDKIPNVRVFLYFSYILLKRLSIIWSHQAE
jgi:hypothetical protein